jgi:hypothetical protein
MLPMGAAIGPRFGGCSFRKFHPDQELKVKTEVLAGNREFLERFWELWSEGMANESLDKAIIVCERNLHFV